jgi:20S proteasome alpha/beta subunit
MGFKVTVCIAALCNQKRKIVAVSDTKTSFGVFSADDISIKSIPIAKNWIALQAGEDVTDAQFITDRARELLIPNVSPTPIEASTALQDAYIERTRKQVEAQVFARYGYTWEAFRQSGKADLTKKIFNELAERAAGVTLSIQFILAGFDSDGQGHLYTVDGERAPASWDTVGFCAIGTGSNVALSTLTFHVDRGNLSTYFGWADCVCCVCDAKFRSESATDVGKGTFLTIYERDQDTRFISRVRIDNDLRTDWERRAKLPKRVIESIPDKTFTIDELFTKEGVRRFFGAKRTRGRQTMQENEMLKRAVAHHDQKV